MFKNAAYIKTERVCLCSAMSNPMQGSMLYAFVVSWFVVWAFVFWFVNSRVPVEPEDFSDGGQVRTVRKAVDKTPLLVDMTLDWSKHFVHKFNNNEPHTNTKMKELLAELPQNTAIVDVGAHVGDTGLYLASHLKARYPTRGLRVIMIEPDATKLEFIRKTAELNGLEDYVTLINRGVSDVPRSRGSLKVNKRSPGATKLDASGEGDIEIDTMDNLCEGHRVSMLHVDVEGMEHAALLGAARIMKHEAKYVMIELNSVSDRTAERRLLAAHRFTHLPDANIEREFKNHLFVRARTV